jgi:hypothetical protein
MLTFLFIDGLGLTADPRSPLHTANIPTLNALTHNFAPRAFDQPHLAYRALDARLGIEGLPQSGTGQTTLLTGVNAAEVLGHHQGPHPGSRLQALLRLHSLPVRATAKGLRVIHTNGYRTDYLERVLAARRNMLSAFAFASRVAGLDLLDLEHPKAVGAAFWDNPEAAGLKLATLAKQHDLTFFEYWALDYAGHRHPEMLEERLMELDRFVTGYLNAPSPPTLLLTSDHGNAEEPWHAQHTTNPVPLVVKGPLAGALKQAQSLTDVAGWVEQTWD